MNILDILRITPRKRKVKIKKGHGIIYNNPSGSKRYFFYFGNGVVLVAIISFIYLYYPLGKALYFYKFHSKQDETNLSTFQNVPSSTPTINEFYIQIPKILASSTVIPDISPYDTNEYLKILSDNVIAQAKGSPPPGLGDGKTTYLFAHSSQEGISMVRKNSVFYLLGEMSMGDVIFVKYNGKVYTYRTYMKRIVNSSEVQYLDFKDENKEVLILQTCWPIGTDWKRLLVFAQRV